MDEVRDIKTQCLMVSPNEKLWRGPTKHIPEVRHIFHHLMSLKYEDKPDYALIRNNLKNILATNDPIGRPLSVPRLP
jgi:hypothetical protein